VALLFQRGTIVLVEQVPDPNGGNHKDRPVILINDLDTADTVFHGVGVTGTFKLPLPPTSINLPYQRQGKCKTGLTKPCIAMCTWIVTATPGEIMHKLGSTPDSQFLEILQQVQGNLPPATSSGN
jgi:mRNA-degrading endonuclease toxin of MazEF toxin-antitoxin module